MRKQAVIAIVGKPNVGKSTLFNRLIGKRRAITSEIAGTTRDQVSHTWNCMGYETVLIDTAGLDDEIKENIDKDVQAQAKIAIETADIILFMADASKGLTVDDFAAAEILRRSKKPVVLIAGKCDNKNIEENASDIYELGFGEAVNVSSVHKIGIEKLEEAVVTTLKKLKFKKTEGEEKDISDAAKICILGKPNVGKSSLANSLLGKRKHIVSDIPGTTRDTVDSEIEYEGKKYILVDTAGIRRRGKIEKGIERFSEMRTQAAVERSTVVVLLMDGTEKISKQDCHIAQLALEKEKGLILAINKTDLFKEKEETARNKIIGELRFRFDFVPWAPVIFISAKNKKNIFEIFNITNKIIQNRGKRITTAVLNAFLQKITYKHAPASTSVKKPKFFYGSQADINPPTFTLFFRNAGNMHFSYPRYLENEIRKEYGFEGTVINLKFKESRGE